MSDEDDARLFLDALGADLPEDERLILCGFRGNPNKVPPNAWKPRPWRPGRELPLDIRDNAYVTVGSFRRAGDGSFRRRGETFCAGRALMVDDVGTKVPLAKMIDLETIAPFVQPSAIVETSPGNFQWWYFLAEPERDVTRFDGVIRAFIAGKLLGADPGMSGVTRVGRIPGFRNAKPQHCEADPKGWLVRLAEMNDARYTVDELLDGFGLKINGQRVSKVKLVSEEAIERNRLFADMYRFLRQRSMLKRQEPDPSGWTEIHCPWMDDHTDGADTGAAVREPSPENEYYGAFRCHHGHCADRGWAELTEWMNELSVEELEHANEAARGMPPEVAT